MKESMGSVFLFNIIITFILFVFAFLAITLSYSKAFKVNSRMISAIEKHEGYNDLARKEMNNVLKGLGYRMEPGLNFSNVCPNREGTLVSRADEMSHRVCVYYNDYGNANGDFYNYGVVTFIFINIPGFGELFQFPIYSVTNDIYRFGN